MRFGIGVKRWATALTLAAATIGMGQVAQAQTCPNGKTMVIVAHEDDDIIFMGSDVISDANAGKCIRTVYVTAGHAGGTSSYWLSREQGGVAAHARLVGVDPVTTDSSITIGSHVLAMRTLTANPRISMVFMRLPDGGQGGDGFPQDTGGPSLRKLWYLDIPTLPTVSDANVDGLANLTSYDDLDLTRTLQKLITKFAPDRIRIQNHGTLTPVDDHSDHIITAHYAYQAAKPYARSRGIKMADLVTGYLGYETYLYPQNIFGAALAAKNELMSKYGAFDLGTCASRDCNSFDEIGLNGNWWGYPRWMSRQYTLAQQVDVNTLNPGFEIRGLEDKCIDVRGAGIADGTPVQIYSCADVQQQKWVFVPYRDVEDPAKVHTLIDQNSRKCLTVGSTSPGNGAKLTIATCSGSAAQKWTFSADGEIVGAGGKCVNVPQGNAADGSRLDVRDCDYSRQQAWGFGGSATVQAPTHQVQTTSGEFCLAAEPATSFKAVVAVTLRACVTGAVNQQWRFAPSRQLRGAGGKCLSIADLDDVTPGKDVVMRPCDLQTSPTPEANLWHAGSGKDVVAHIATGKFVGLNCLQPRGGVGGEGVIVETGTCNGALVQNWRISPPFP